MITPADIAKYNEIRNTQDAKSADAFAAETIAALSLETPAARGKCWAQFKEESKLEDLKTQSSAKKAAAKAKREEAKARASIKKICTAILSKEILLKSNECSFIKDIATKRKLTEKQESWLRSIAEKCNVTITGNIERKASKIEIHCEHEDLGSLGYIHGQIVTCPHCGQRAEVW